MAHGEDLRVTSSNDVLAHAAMHGNVDPLLDEANRALCRWALKLTLTPAKCGKPDVDELRGHGFSDEQIVHAAQVIGYFNYINRIADGLGVDLEPEMHRPDTGPWAIVPA